MRGGGGPPPGGAPRPPRGPRRGGNRPPRLPKAPPGLGTPGRRSPTFSENRLFRPLAASLQEASVASLRPGPGLPRAWPAPGLACPGPGLPWAWPAPCHRAGLPRGNPATGQSCHGAGPFPDQKRGPQRELKYQDWVHPDFLVPSRNVFGTESEGKLTCGTLQRDWRSQNHGQNEGGNHS